MPIRGRATSSSRPTPYRGRPRCSSTRGAVLLGAMPFPRQVPYIPKESDTHELRTDVVYAEADGVPLRFDHYRARKVDGPAPVVVFVHGGAWMHGDPSQAAGNALHFA